tara:strand:- start:470 stop:883 length:414 start_codon:yes stop_codon:yes gene_type:complete
MRIIKIDYQNKYLISDFIKSAGESLVKFRYFDKRDLNVISNHIYTCIMLLNDKPIGYGHLDLEDRKVWLGICIIQRDKGKGYGKILINDLLLNAKKNQIKEIYLTVDKDNITAYNFYKKFNFKKIKSNDSSYFMLKK